MAARHEDEAEWIKASVAVRRLGPSRGGCNRAAAFLVERAALGLIHPRADLRIETRERSRRPDEVTEHPTEAAARWIWAASRDRHARTDFDWSADAFTAWEAPAPEGGFRRVKQVELVGVEFSAAEVVGLIPADLRAAAERDDDAGNGSDLAASAPERDLSAEPFMGLVETVAWIASRDSTLSAAVRWRSLDGDRVDSAAAYYSLVQYLAQSGASAADAAQDLIRRCAGGDLDAKGVQGGGFEDVPADDWQGARLVFEKEPDKLLTHGPHNSLSAPRWSHVRFRRTDVLAFWPRRDAPSIADTAPAPPPEPKKLRRGARPGPRPETWAADVELVFKKHHDHMVDMSERQRHDYLLTFCKGPRSARTTARHWDAHLERRAQDSR